jgi:hypothetical protein
VLLALWHLPPIKARIKKELAGKQQKREKKIIQKETSRGKNIRPASHFLFPVPFLGLF